MSPTLPLLGSSTQAAAAVPPARPDAPQEKVEADGGCRLRPAAFPLPEFARAAIAGTTPEGRAPLLLFTTLATDRRLFERLFGGGLLDRGHLSLRQREIVIDRITARCGSEYEFGAHVSAFGERAGLSKRQIASLATGSAADACWDDNDRTLISLVDTVDVSCTVDDQGWDAARTVLSEHAICEVLMLCGFYRTVSYLANVLRLPNEEWGARFSEFKISDEGTQG